MGLFKKWFSPQTSRRKVAAAQAAEQQQQAQFQQQMAAQERAVQVQQESVAKQEQVVQKQEQALDTEKANVAKSKYGRLRAVRRGGSLLSAERSAPETGLSTTLGMGTRLG